MKHATIPYPREFGPGASGIDCRAVKRALAVALGGPHGMALKTNTFSKPAQAALAEFKRRHGLLNDPIYTVPAHEKLTGSFDEYGAAMMNKAAAHYAAVKQRSAFIATLDWMLAHHGQFDYAEVRPIPVNLAPFTTTRIRTDCSGSIEIASKWSKIPDPSKLGYSGAGNTGSLLSACTHIASTSAQHGDLIVYRRDAGDMYGHHVVAILDVVGPHADFDVFSHGRQGDPAKYRHSVMLASQRRSGYGYATFLRFLPVP